MILDNDFEVGAHLALDPPNTAVRAYVGISLFRCRGYKVEENTFERFFGAGTENPTGIHINASGPYYNEIYKNYFQDMTIANLANRGNKGPDANIGLQYLCNESLGGNEFDFAVDDKVASTIRENQGSFVAPAGNLFTFPASPVPLDFTHFNNQGSDLTYFFVDLPDQEPTDFTSSSIELEELFEQNNCPSKLPDDFDGKLSESEKLQHIQDFYNSTDAGKKMHASNILIHHFLSDSIEYNLDSVRYWLSERGGLEDHFQIVNTYVGEKDATAAQVALDAIPNIFTLLDTELTEYQYFDSLKTIQINALINGQSEEQMVVQHQSALVSIADAIDYGASGEARALLNNVLGEVYPHEIYFPDSVGQGQIIQPPSTKIFSGELFYIKAVPNPTSTGTAFYYQLPDHAESGELQINSLDGKRLEEIELEGNSGKVEWKTDSLQPGIYLYSLWLDGKKVAIERLVVQN